MFVLTFNRCLLLAFFVFFVTIFLTPCSYLAPLGVFQNQRTIRLFILIGLEVVEDREDPDQEVDRVDRVHQTPRVVDREAHHILAAHREAVDHRTLHPQVEDRVAVNHVTLGVDPVERILADPKVVDPEVHHKWVGVDPLVLVVHRNPAVVDLEVVDHRN